MQERDLRESILRIGVQVSGLEYDGVLLDGRKKAAICLELGIAFHIQEAKTFEEACSILWTRHPARALAFAGKLSVLELATLCSTNPVAIANEMRAENSKPKRQKRRRIEGQPYPQLKESKRMLRRLFVLEPELYAYAQEAAKQSGHGNVNRLVRDALWAKVALLVPQAPQYQPKRIQTPNGSRVPKRRVG
jgi:hypothetical protein